MGNSIPPNRKSALRSQETASGGGEPLSRTTSYAVLTRCNLCARVVAATELPLIVAEGIGPGLLRVVVLEARRQPSQDLPVHGRAVVESVLALIRVDAAIAGAGGLVLVVRHVEGRIDERSPLVEEATEVRPGLDRAEILALLRSLAEVLEDPDREEGPVEAVARRHVGRDGTFGVLVVAVQDAVPDGGRQRQSRGQTVGAEEGRVVDLGTALGLELRRGG